MITCAVLGLLFNLGGVVIAGWAILTENRKHEGPPVVPIAAAQEWLRVNILRKPPTPRNAGFAAGTVHAVGTARGSAVVWPAAEAPIATQVEYLQRAVMDVHSQIAAERQETDVKVTQVRNALSDRIGKAEQAASETAQAVRSLATDSMRWEVVGLLCVGLGSAISVLPVLFGWT